MRGYIYLLNIYKILNDKLLLAIIGGGKKKIFWYQQKKKNNFNGKFK